MVHRNPNFNALSPFYLFPEIKRKVLEWKEKNPNAKLINLGVGDTTEALPKHIIDAFKDFAEELGTKEGYRGYGPEQGEKRLREKVSEVIYKGKIAPDEIFISDGAKCDIGRIQVLFGQNVTLSVQDPTYPVYVDSSRLLGQKKIHFMPCKPENDFFPTLGPRSDLIFFCSPNNPTGKAASAGELKKLIAFAKKNNAIVIYDSAYAPYIRSDAPKTIYEIEEAEAVAIETSSFSKLIGFTGIRLGWTVVPKALKYEDGGLVHSDWNRISTTLFNGASSIAQAGGFAALSQGLSAIRAMTDFYLENCQLLAKSLSNFVTFGGKDAPYLWLKTEMSSWDAFHFFLDRFQIITTPGSGFGPAGEGFLRLSAFGHRETILEAARRLK